MRTRCWEHLSEHPDHLLAECRTELLPGALLETEHGRGGGGVCSCARLPQLCNCHVNTFTSTLAAARAGGSKMCLWEEDTSLRWTSEFRR